MTCTGKDKIHTAMTLTGGLPAGIGAKLILNRTVKERGVIIPVHTDIYEPVLEELKSLGISFSEEERQISAA
jgi:saccharopine dehydrogenase-like NADP-dependent oxidoreductase